MYSIQVSLRLGVKNNQTEVLNFLPQMNAFIYQDTVNTQYRRASGSGNNKMNQSQ